MITRSAVENGPIDGLFIVFNILLYMAKSLVPDFRYLSTILAQNR